MFINNITESEKIFSGEFSVSDLEDAVNGQPVFRFAGEIIACRRIVIHHFAVFGNGSDCG